MGVKQGDKSFYRVMGKEVDKDKSEITEKINDEVKKTEMSMADLHKFLKSKKGDLEFVENYVKNDRAKYQAGGAKKKRSIKKSAKKGSKKSAKKGSKKSAEKGSKKTAKKGSKKSAKKDSKKFPKKGSKKRYGM